jgi:ElaB/YqjD/DUF883 family membrane-anchored ribosome-binding protein
MGLFTKIKHSTAELGDTGSDTLAAIKKRIEDSLDTGSLKDLRAAQTGADLRALLGQLDHALRDASQSELQSLRAKARPHLADLHDVLDEARASLRSGYRTAVSVSEERLRTRPWQTLGIVSGVALVLGAVIFRS